MEYNQNTFCHRKEEPEESILYIVATPIGNLNDISLRALNILRRVSFIACEDTRTTKILLKNHGISNRLTSLNQHNINSKVNFIVSELKNKKSIALVCDAGMPLISDPGELLVKLVRENKFDVICVPGACAAITALVCSGLSTSQFVFYGFIPRNNKAKKEILSAIQMSNYSSIVYESPKRIINFLKDLKKYCGGGREIMITKELTKTFEQHIGKNINEALTFFENFQPRGEFTIVIAGEKKKKLDDIENLEIIRNDLIMLINAGLSHSAAANYLSNKYKESKNKIYNLIKNK